MNCDATVRPLQGVVTPPGPSTLLFHAGQRPITAQPVAQGLRIFSAHVTCCLPHVPETLGDVCGGPQHLIVLSRTQQMSSAAVSFGMRWECTLPIGIKFDIQVLHHASSPRCRLHYNILRLPPALKLSLVFTRSISYGLS